ncbi:phosphoribosylanthranilate transferase Trp4 [Schizosaccharomyces cryophilus OY26]|uniref:Anthranilate phosphoribosyltransferase n=1 Tax=Schizosaccharomyces cryophilus (strain OY26 / ATCC MYA-4695 / CBS 11777 / NBRC 106824 / NRRL Y48691) TaxID=653667 RepID=S9WZZ5_SCHCR|nr:phosphoribosylanthranilate transferase Trp4 [Schizosaccharomyces cryophilus OY26]EPY50277.1 phosphoribosylanthranilate transferase Trp4 [Schizosaccharomyces cryophilus OY26]
MSLSSAAVRRAMQVIDRVGLDIPIYEIEHALRDILEEKSNPVQIGAFLTAMRLTRVEQRPEVLMSTVNIIRSYSIPIEGISSMQPKFVDIVGTGGDGHNTFNVSTASAIIAAGAGLHICKHGNKASTSSSGSADLLMSFGCDLLNVTAKNLISIADESKFSFLFAPQCHPRLKVVAPVRKEIGVPSIFNLVGPLLNPVPTYARIIGVSHPTLGPTFAQALLLLGADRSLVVCGEEGLDEISPAGPTHAWLVKDGQITQMILTPESFHLPYHPLSSVASGTPSANAVLLQRLLSNLLPKNHPILDYVLMNTAMLLHVAGLADSLYHGVILAQESIASRSALTELERFASATRIFQ